MFQIILYDVITIMQNFTPFLCSKNLDVYVAGNSAADRVVLDARDSFKSSGDCP